MLVREGCSSDPNTWALYFMILGTVLLVAAGISLYQRVKHDPAKEKIDV